MSEATALQLPATENPLAGIAVQRIGRLAADPDAKRTPDQVIERELRRAGVGGSYKTSERFRVAYAHCASAYVDARAELTPEITAELLWRMYDRKVSQHLVARRIGSTQTRVRERSQKLGFHMVRAGAGRLWYVPTRGPCLGCGEVFDVERLDGAHRCKDCR